MMIIIKIVCVFINLGRERVDLLMLHRCSVTRCTDLCRTGVLRSLIRQRFRAPTTSSWITCRNVGRRAGLKRRGLRLYRDTSTSVGVYVRGVGNNGGR